MEGSVQHRLPISVYVLRFWLQVYAKTISGSLPTHAQTLPKHTQLIPSSCPNHIQIMPATYPKQAMAYMEQRWETARALRAEPILFLAQIGVAAEWCFQHWPTVQRQRNATVGGRFLLWAAFEYLPQKGHSAHSARQWMVDMTWPGLHQVRGWKRQLAGAEGKALQRDPGAMIAPDPHARQHEAVCMVLR